MNSGIIKFASLSFLSHLVALLSESLGVRAGYEVEGVHVSVHAHRHAGLELEKREMNQMLVVQGSRKIEANSLRSRLFGSTRS